MSHQVQTPNGIEYLYSWFDATRLPAEIRREARDAVDLAAADLGVDPPKIRWFQPWKPGLVPARVHPREVYGLADTIGKQTIYISVEAPDIRGVVAHEMAHIAAANEQEAQEYAGAFRVLDGLGIR